MIPLHQLGWMAGVVDLKGKIIQKANKSRATPQIVLFVESKDAAIIRELSRMTGTGPEMMRIPEKATFYRRPCSDHCPDMHSHVNETQFPQVARWTVTGAAIAVILYNLMPFLRSDKGFDQLYVTLLEQMSLTGQGSGATVKSLRRLHSLGWDLPEEIARELPGEAPAELLAIEAA